MPLLGSYILILTHSLTTLTTAYILLTSPARLTTTNSIWLLGEAMHIRPPPPSFAVPSEPLALIAALLALCALTHIFFASSLTPLSTSSKTDKNNTGALAESVAVLRAAQSSWLSLAGTRVFLSASLTMWIYLVHSERRGGGGVIIDGETLSGIKGLGLLANSVVFTAAMVDMFFWGYVWTVIKEEGRGLAQSVMNSREQRQAVLNQDGTVSWEDKS